MAVDSNSRFDMSSSKANMELAKDIAKDKSLTGARYKLSEMDPEYGPMGTSHARFKTPRTPLEFNIEDASNFKYDMDHCIKCKGCYWVEHTYNPGVKFNVRCPSNLFNDFDAYGAMGKMRIGVGLLEGDLEWTPTLVNILYSCPLCGACDVACKRNLDLEVELSLEALRVKAVQDGVAPLPAHKAAVDKILETGNIYGSKEDRKAWAKGVKVAKKADTLYYVGDNTSYKNPQIAQATAKILEKLGIDFMLLDNEKNEGNVVISIGMMDEAKKIAKETVDAIKATGASTVVVSDAEVYRTLKADIPKVLNIATADLGFKVVHIMELAAKAIEDGTLTLTTPIDSRIAYHDASSVSRLCDDWTPYKGERGWMGMIYPGQRRRRGRQGLYKEARTIMAAVPGADNTEFIRIRENALDICAGRGTDIAFPALTKFATEKRLEEAKYLGIETIVSADPQVRDAFNTYADPKDGIKAIDITELIVAAL
ncbi:MAG: (Fe-S)-binding protein [Anaerovoracaceae bacterium]|jgi:Fe-S oxidoreductase